MTIEDIRALVTDIRPVGSRVTCNPPPVDTDIDYLVLVTNDQFDSLLPDLFSQGFDIDGSEVCDPADHLSNKDTFQSFSHGDLNLIVTQDSEFFRRFLAATEVAKRLNLLVKEDRVALFQAVLYANPDMRQMPSAPWAAAVVEEDDLLGFI